ncbi:MAG: acyl-CoA dehydrogenase family protein [Devosia sp.]
MILTEEQQALDRRLGETITRVSPVERFQRLDADRQFDHDLHAALAELGVWGLGIPREDGGSAGTSVDQMIALRALGHYVTSMGMFGVVNFLCTRILNANATAAQRGEFLQPLARGAAKASFCLTEAQGGTDILRVMATRAVHDGRDYVIDGTKAWICGASFSDFYIVVARTSEGKTDGVSMFIVPHNAPGVQVRRIETFAVNGYEVSEVRFDQVRVPAANLLGQEGKGFRQLVAMLNSERLSASANALGMTRGALEVAAAHAKGRKAFGKTLADFQAVQHKLANAALVYELAWTYLVTTAQADDRKEKIDVASSMAKVAAVNAAQQAADMGMEILGAAAFDVGNPMQRITAITGFT